MPTTDERNIIPFLAHEDAATSDIGRVRARRKGLTVSGMQDGRTFGRRDKTASSPSSRSDHNDRRFQHIYSQHFDTVLCYLLDKQGVPRDLRKREAQRSRKDKTAERFWHGVEEYRLAKQEGGDTQAVADKLRTRISVKPERVCDDAQYSEINAEWVG